MNCIFICLFNNKEYLKLLNLLLESIFIHNDLYGIEILIYTNTYFMNKIKQSHLMYPFIKFEVNDTYNDVNLACKSRLDLFYLNSINRYEKILYLDTDILIKNDLQEVFDLCEDELLYVLEEGIVNDTRNFYGISLFNSIEFEEHKGKTAFTSGIMLFKNCDKIKSFFNIVRDDIIKRPYNFNCYDQPYIVYNAFIYQIYNNQSLKNVAVNLNNDINSKYTIHHFPGNPGYHVKKITVMSDFMYQLKESYISNAIEKTKYFISQKLLPIISQCNELIEGNIFMDHHTNKFSDTFILKVKNICNLLLNKQIKNVCEIGFNSGFSTLLMLICNSNVKIKCFDLGEHSYTIPCYQAIKEIYGDRVELIIGDSTKTLPIYVSQFGYDKFDLIHIDGGHETEVATSDIQHSLKLSRYGTILIMDDYDFENLKILWDKYINEYNLKKIVINEYNSPHHDIRYIGYNFDLYLSCTVDLIQQLNQKDNFGYDLKSYLTNERIGYLKNIWNIVNNEKTKSIMLIGEDRLFVSLFILLSNPDINVSWNSLKINDEMNEEINKKVILIKNNISISSALDLLNRFDFVYGNNLSYEKIFEVINIDSKQYIEEYYLIIFEYISNYINSSVLLIENYKQNKETQFLFDSFCEFYHLKCKKINDYQMICIK